LVPRFKGEMHRSGVLNIAVFGFEPFRAPIGSLGGVLTKEKKEEKGGRVLKVLKREVS